MEFCKIDPMTAFSTGVSSVLDDDMPTYMFCPTDSYVGIFLPYVAYLLLLLGWGQCLFT
jgi:hypothetical protein